MRICLLDMLVVEIRDVKFADCKIIPVLEIGNILNKK